MSEKVRVINRADLLKVVEVAIDSNVTITEYGNLEFEHSLLNIVNLEWLRAALIDRGYAVEKIDQYLNSLL